MRNLVKKGKFEEHGKEYLEKTSVIKQMDVSSDESVFFSRRGSCGKIRADEFKTQELFRRFAAKMEQYFATTSQSSDDIAKIVKSVILSEKPSLRYQTNEKYRPRMRSKLNLWIQVEIL